MATSNYTPSVRLALPTAGDLDGTWGAEVNDNITTFTDQAIAGMVTINAWTGNTHTLTANSGSADEARYAILKLVAGGGLPNAAATLICPTSVTKTYIVNNGTGQTVTVKTSGGTGFAIPTGTVAQVYCDGTNVLSAITYIANSAIAFSNMALGTINSTTIGATTPSTGAFTTVVATSIGLASQGSGKFTTLQATTGINSTTIGATTPSTGKFTTVEATVEVTTGRLTATNGLRSPGVGNNSFRAGTSAGAVSQGANAISIGNRAGEDSQGANGILISSKGSVINDTTAGHIHIASNSASLDYTGAAGWSISNGSVDVAFPSTAGTLALTSQLPTSTNLLPLNNTWTGTNTFNNTITGSITGNAATVTNGVYKTGAQTIGGTKTFSATIAGSITGNSATCTTAANSSKLQGFESTNGNTGNTIVRRASNGSFSAGTITATLSGSSTSCTGNSATVTNGIYTTGNQSISGLKTFTGGLRSPGSGANSFRAGTLAGFSAQGSNAIAIGHKAGYSGQHANSIVISSKGTAVNTAAAGSIVIESSTALLFTLGANWAHTGTMTSTSDIRLKKDIEPITDALAKVQSLNGITFSYIESGAVATGLIAQDVQAVLPEAVIEINDEGHLGLAYGNMVGLLVESIKELTARVEALEG